MSAELYLSFLGSRNQKKILAIPKQCYSLTRIALRYKMRLLLYTVRLQKFVQSRDKISALRNAKKCTRLNMELFAQIMLT